MKMFTFAKRTAVAPSPVRPPAGKPVEPAGAKPQLQAAPQVRSTDADGRLRRTRQVVEDNRLL